MSSRGFSVLVALLLVLSLGVKAVAAAGEPSSNPDAIPSALRTMLGGAGFDARIHRLSRSPGILIEARRGECRILAGDYPVHDTFANVYQDIARRSGSLLFVYRGRIHSDPPKARSMLDFFLWREARRVGISPPRTPVMAVIASPGCDARTLPWERVAFIDG